MSLSVLGTVFVPSLGVAFDSGTAVCEGRGSVHDQDADAWREERVREKRESASEREQRGRWKCGGG